MQVRSNRTFHGSMTGLRLTVGSVLLLLDRIRSKAVMRSVVVLTCLGITFQHFIWLFFVFTPSQYFTSNINPFSNFFLLFSIIFFAIPLAFFLPILLLLTINPEKWLEPLWSLSRLRNEKKSESVGKQQTGFETSRGQHTIRSSIRREGAEGPRNWSRYAITNYTHWPPFQWRRDVVYFEYRDPSFTCVLWRHWRAKIKLRH